MSRYRHELVLVFHGDGPPRVRALVRLGCQVKRIVAVSDMQVPYHDPKAVEAVTAFVRDYQPDLLLCVGDEADSPEPSRWTKGLAEEYGGTLQAGLDATKQVLTSLRQAAGDAPFVIQRSNHGDRIRTYINRYAPALSSLRELEYERLLGFEELEIIQSRTPYPFARGWVMAHGDEGASNRTPGGTALGLARAFGRSVVCGHTHKQGLVHDHDSVDGRVTRSLFGMEVGHLMDLRQAHYLKAGSANWQQGFGLLTVTDDNRVLPSTVPIVDRRFVVDGRVYAW